VISYSSSHALSVLKHSVTFACSLSSYQVFQKSAWSVWPSAPPGMSDDQTLHADFWNTWHEDKLQAKVTECFNTDKACDEL